MKYFLLIAGIVLVPQAWCLKCKVCETQGSECVGEETCSANFTRCGIARIVSYVEGTVDREEIKVSCFPEHVCRAGSVNLGPYSVYYTTKCCDTDNCNTEKPPDVFIKSRPNGVKCDLCTRGGSCNGTVDCVDDQTYCTTINPKIKGCATRSFCVDRPFFLDNLEEMTCRGGSSPRAGLNPLSTLLLPLISLIFYK
ncbi:hypothetical protein NL108_016462 [Boleophthalmus pectinirostris]|nr:hypothetical protein NL108_016462 [Boleophthalmus pectinirostris]